MDYTSTMTDAKITPNLQDAEQLETIYAQFPAVTRSKATAAMAAVKASQAR
jgi:hypothetical protein